MKIKLKTYIVLIISFFNFILLNNQIVKAETEIDYNKTYKIGVIDFEPYVNLNDKKEVSGYYIDLFDLIAEELNLNYEYVLVNNNEAINKVESGELDFSLGITITSERAERVSFNLNPIALEKFALYTNKDIDEQELYKLNGLRFGTVKGRSTDWILNFFEASNLDVKVVYGESYDEINEFIKDGKIDLLLDSAYKETNYNKIYEFVESQVYIASKKGNKEILNLIDKTIIDLNKKDAKIDKLYNSYFNLEKLKEERSKFLLEIVFKILIVMILLIILIKTLRVKIYEIKIKRALSLGKYKIKYSPIYRVSDKVVVGYEALLKNKKDNIVYSKEFIKDRRKDFIVFKSCIWILKDIIRTSPKIKNTEYFKDKDFYISISIPINQFKYERFICEIIKLAKENKVEKNTICLGIIGRAAINNINDISSNLKKLKEAGFIIALDDFGIEYSNLNIIQDLDIDIIKINKSFTLDLDKSLVKKEIILFISRIAKATNKFVILEGIESLEQEKNIKKIDSDKIYIQGNIYNEPLNINYINKII